MSLSPLLRSQLRSLLLLVLTLAGATAAQAAPEITPTPATFSPGAKIKVAAENLTANTSYKLKLEQASPGTAKYDLTTFQSGLSDHTTLAPTIPSATAGAYLIVLYSGSITLTKVAEAPVKVVQGLTVTLTPTSAAPGKAVQIQVGNLVAGSVRVKYAGVTILGPTAVGGGTWTGKFVVPSDRPASLPASVTVAVDNLIGKTIPKSGSATFNAKAVSTAPKLSVNFTAVTGSKLDRGSTFLLGGTLKTDDGVAPTGDQHLYWKGDNGVVLPIDSKTTVQPDGTFAMEARTPDYYRDGFQAIDDQSGDLVVVNQSVDVNTDSKSDIEALADQPKKVLVDGDAGGSTTFTLILKGNEAGSNDPLLQGVVVEAQEDYRSAFGFATPNSGTGNDNRVVLGSLQPTQFTGSLTANFPPANNGTYGCDIAPFRRISTSEGKVTFAINPDEIRRSNFQAVVEDCFGNGPCGGEEVQFEVPGGIQMRAEAKARTKAGTVEVGDAIAFVMQIYSAHLGYRSVPISLGYLPDTKQFVNVETGALFVNNTGTVLLEPSQNDDVDLRDFRIDGLGPPMEKPGGQCGYLPHCWYVPYIFGSVENGDVANGTLYSAMYTFPNSTKWPNIAVPNSGRKARLTVFPGISGTITQGLVRLNGFAPVPLVAQGGAAGCVLDQTEAIEYVAALPNLTRIPAGPLYGTVELTFGQFVMPPKPFVILTQTPPTGIDVQNQNIATLTIDALNDRISGDYKTRELGIPVGSPGYGIDRLDNDSVNTSSFDFVRTPDRSAANKITSASNNDIAGNPGGPKPSQGVRFGFKSENSNEPEPIILFDTGLIPLFRYTWGLEPIAGATLGADFWLASQLEYYGRLKSTGMDATVDPTVAGGVDIFFDLDILLGLVSASITAETSIGVTMRSVIGQGGIAGQQSGECFKFDLDIEWEACCAGICAGDEVPLLQVREPSQAACSAARSSAGMSPLLAKALLPDSDGFDLPRPKLVASAVATDGRGTSISIGVNSNGALVATHLSGSSVEFTRTIDASTVGVQHLDVAFHGTNRAMAVWSENTRTATDIGTLFTNQGAGAFDDIARTQRLRYSYWDGIKWSTPANLTTAGSDGKPQLAGCIAPVRFLGTSTCPAGGEITAVWERDANANLSAPDLEVWSASWSPGTKTWDTAARVSATGVSSDMLPSVAYRNEVPVVAWVNNPGGQFVALAKRRAMYRFLDKVSIAHVATDLGAAVGWLALGVDPSDRLVLAYTQAQDTAGFVGNRQALRVARGDCDAGLCVFDVTEPRDPNGRQYRVERPNVMFDEDGVTMIGFRALGFGANAQGQVGLAGDTPGTLLGTGEVAIVRIPNFTAAQVQTEFRPLTNDGLQHWKPDMVYDDTVAGVISLSRDAAAPLGKSTAMEFAKSFSPKGLATQTLATALDDGSALRTLGAGPDFTLRDAVPSKRVVSGGDAFTLGLKLVNQGQAYVPAVHGSLKVVASWNGPAGAGTPAGSYTLTQSQAANAVRSLTLAITVPNGVRSDERQTLFIDIVADEDANEIGGAADQLREVFNIMPVPTKLALATRLDSNFVNITWDSPADARIAGWRIWRRRGDGIWIHVGATTSKGYMDLFAPRGVELNYRVASYSENGMESEPSATAWGFIQRLKGPVVFANGFESP